MISFFQCGHHMLCTLGTGFTLDPTLGEFILTHPDIRIPKQGKIYSINEGNSCYWDEATSAFVGWCKQKPKVMSLCYASKSMYFACT